MPRATTIDQQFSLFGIKFSTKIKPSLSFEQNKAAFILDDIMSNNQIIEEIKKRIDCFVSETEENEQYLQHLNKKLSCTSNDESVDEKDTNYLQKSLQFVISGKVLSFSDEKRPISEFNLNKNHGDIQMVLNLSRGFKDLAVEEEQDQEQDERIEEVPVQENRTFICEKHNEKTTHYCKTCKKLICGYELVGDDSQSGFFFLSF